jgi:hypothetical protein
MKTDLRTLDIEELKQAYLSESEKLKNCLLNGARWEDITEQRHRLIEFEIALYQKTRFTKTTSSSRKYFGNTEW